jgi:hypothetical protein
MASSSAAPQRKRKALAAAAGNATAATEPDLLPAFAFFEMQGKREYMEDRVLAATPMQTGSPFHFFGVYDGHGGAEASQYCKDHMIEAFASHPTLKEATVPAALRAAYSRVDTEFCKIAADSKGKIESGTTAVSVVVGANQFWVANTGACQCVMPTQQLRLALTCCRAPTPPAAVTVSAAFLDCCWCCCHRFCCCCPLCGTALLQGIRAPCLCRWMARPRR